MHHFTWRIVLNITVCHLHHIVGYMVQGTFLVHRYIYIYIYVYNRHKKCTYVGGTNDSLNPNYFSQTTTSCPSIKSLVQEVNNLCVNKSVIKGHNLFASIPICSDGYSLNRTLSYKKAVFYPSTCSIGYCLKETYILFVSEQMFMGERVFSYIFIRATTNTGCSTTTTSTIHITTT